jgi:hypothetical protein
LLILSKQKSPKPNSAKNKNWQKEKEMKTYTLIAVAAMATSLTTLAETIECTAKVPSTGCGSGTIEVKFDTKTLSHQSITGAIGCWGHDYEYSGAVVEDKKTYPFYSSRSFQLFDKNGTLAARLYLEKSQVKERPIVAALDMTNINIHSGPLVRSQFNLTCKAIEEPDHEEECSEPHPFLGCHGW